MAKIENIHDVSGEIIHIELPNGSNPKFSFQRIVLEVWKNHYREEVPFMFINKNMQLFKGFALGDHVHITFHLSGRGWMKDGEMRWTVTLDAVNISRL